MNKQREARRDAKEYARAQMFYGEGAGIRRKLITASIESKAHRDPAYARAFHTELARQDMAEHATKARRERERKDTTQAVSRNAKAIATGNYQNAQTGILLVLVGGYFAHQSGLDKKVYEKGRAFVQDVRTRIRSKRKGPSRNFYDVNSKN